MLNWQNTSMIAHGRIVFNMFYGLVWGFLGCSRFFFFARNELRQSRRYLSTSSLLLTNMNFESLQKSCHHRPSWKIATSIQVSGKGPFSRLFHLLFLWNGKGHGKLHFLETSETSDWRKHKIMTCQAVSPKSSQRKTVPAIRQDSCQEKIGEA